MDYTHLPNSKKVSFLKHYIAKNIRHLCPAFFKFYEPWKNNNDIFGILRKFVVRNRYVFYANIFI